MAGGGGGGRHATGRGGGNDGVDFRVRPETLRDYAATVRGQGGALAEIGGAVGAIAVEPGWFGRLPQSGHLADDYETHHQAGLAGITELMKALLDVAAALEATAGSYSGVDAAAADALGAVRAAGGPPPRATTIAEAIR